MRRLQNSILYLLILLTVLFNIERMDVGGTDVNNLATSVYVLTIIAVLMIITVKWFRTLPLPVFVSLWVAVFFITKLLTSQRPLVGDIYTYLTFTELSLFVVAVLLSQNLARNMAKTERSLNKFAFSSQSRLQGMEEAKEKIQAEIYRGRRFQRPLSIVVMDKGVKSIPINSNTTDQDAQRALLEEYLSAMIIRDLSAQLRQTDLLIEHNKKGRLIIVSPDTDILGVGYLIERLKPLIKSELIDVSFSAATFPEHGLTFEQLLEQAEKRLHSQVDDKISLNPTDVVENKQALT